MIQPNHIENTIEEVVDAGLRRGYYTQQNRENLYNSSLAIAAELTLLTEDAGIGYVNVLAYSLWKASQETGICLNPYQVREACKWEGSGWIKLIEPFSKCLETKTPLEPA